MLYLVRNWERYQHYRKRNPPWIKLHVEILQSDDWIVWDDASRVLAVACMVLAPRSQGVIDGSQRGLEILQKRANLASIPNLKPLVDSGFLQSLNPSNKIGVEEYASTMLAPCYQLATSEAETETESEAESDARARSIDAPEKSGAPATPEPTEPASASRGSPDPDPEHLTQLDALRNTLRRRDPKRYIDADRELRLIAARTTHYSGLPRTHTIAAMLRALQHLDSATQSNTVERWDAYLRKVVLAEAQNSAANDSELRAKQHRDDNNTAARLILGDL